MNTHLASALRSPVSFIQQHHDSFTRLRRDLHAHPELGFEEHRTARARGRAPAPVGYRGAYRHRPHRRGRRGARQARRRGPLDRPARRHGRAADEGRKRRRAQVEEGRADARLRPRRPHDHAAGRRAVPGGNPQLQRHRLPDLPAGRGRLRRRQGHDRGRPVRALPGQRGLRPAQLAGPAGRAYRPESGTDDGRRRSHRDHRSPARGDTPRIRTWRSTRC